MHKKIFLKYYTASVVIILTTMLMLGTATSIVLGIRDSANQTANMERAAQSIAEIYVMTPRNDRMYDRVAMFERAVSSVIQSIDSDCVIYSYSYNIEATNFKINNSERLEPGLIIPQTIVASVLNGQTHKSHIAYEVNAKKVGYTIGIPITSGNMIMGAVFVTTSRNEFVRNFPITMMVYFICSLLVFAISFVIVYIITKRLTRPLYTMSEVAISYANGDFSKRIDMSNSGELSKLALAFNSMADGIDRLEIMRRGFIADVSHELRTPMTVIAGFINGILDGTIPRESQKKYLLIVADEIDRLSRLVSTLLDAAKIQAGQMTYVMHNFDIIEVIGKNIFGIEDRVREKNITLIDELCDDSLYVKGDSDAIYRVIYNLLDNAVKFSDRDGVITVGVKIQDDKAYVYVKNTGKGISKTEAVHIFERFYKTDKSRGINKKGVGIGLYLVKGIIEAHGEDIYLTSKEGEYAQFTFSLALSDNNEQQE